MVQESVAWDFRSMTRTPSTSVEIYIFFLLFVFVVASIKLIRAWRAAPPCRLSRQTSNAAYLQSLQASTDSLRQWIGSALIGGGIVASTSLTHFCYRLLGEKGVERLAPLFAMLDFSTTLSLTLLVVFFSFLVRWHLLKRIDQLRHLPG